MEDYDKLFKFERDIFQVACNYLKKFNRKPCNGLPNNLAITLYQSK